MKIVYKNTGRIIKSRKPYRVKSYIKLKKVFILINNTHQS